MRIKAVLFITIMLTSFHYCYANNLTKKTITEIISKVGITFQEYDKNLFIDKALKIKGSTLSANLILIKEVGWNNEESFDSFQEKLTNSINENNDTKDRKEKECCLGFMTEYDLLSKDFYLTDEQRFEKAKDYYMKAYGLYQAHANMLALPSLLREVNVTINNDYEPEGDNTDFCFRQGCLAIESPGILSPEFNDGNKALNLIIQAVNKGHIEAGFFLSDIQQITEFDNQQTTEISSLEKLPSSTGLKMSEDVSITLYSKILGNLRYFWASPITSEKNKTSESSIKTTPCKNKNRQNHFAPVSFFNACTSNKSTSYDPSRAPNSTLKKRPDLPKRISGVRPQNFSNSFRGSIPTHLNSPQKNKTKKSQPPTETTNNTTSSDEGKSQTLEEYANYFNQLNDFSTP